MADRRWAKLDSVRNDVVSHLANVLGDKSFLDSLLARKCLYYDQYEKLMKDRLALEARTLLGFLRHRPPSIFNSAEERRPNLEGFVRP